MNDVSPSEQLSAAEAERLAMAAEMRKMATERQENADLLAGLEQMLTARLGTTVRHLRSETVMPPRTKLTPYLQKQRTFTRHWLDIAGPVKGSNWPWARGTRLVVFVKSGLNVVCSPLDTILNETNRPGFRAPYFFGSYEASGLRVGVWEFVEGARVRFEDLSLETQIRLVKAVAAVNALPVKDGIPVKTKWASTPLAWYQGAFRKMTVDDQERWRPVLEATAQLLDDDRKISDRLLSFGEDRLTHNDINPNNVFTPEGRDVVIFDWEAAMLSVPGADLRFLTRMEARDVLLSCYVQQMAEFAIKLDTEAVRSAYELVEAFRLIHKGWANRNMGAVRRGLATAAYHVGHGFAITTDLNWRGV